MPLLAQRYFGGAPKRLGLTHALIAPYGAFTCAGGEQVLISIQSNREWKVFCERVLQQPELSEDERFVDNTDRVAHREELQVLIDAVFGRYEREALIGLLNETGIACGQLSEVTDLDQHRFLRNLEAEFDGMTVSMADLPVRTEQPRPTHVPGLGEHSDVIRAEFS